VVLTAPETPIQRRLAAILAADVAGYSRLTGADEEGTMRLLLARREIMDAMIAAHGGLIANTAGDSVMANFASVVDAMKCAIAVQRAHAVDNAPLPRERRVSFRIGVHLGDVMVQGKELFGDGVNIAARLQELAEPGGVAFSAKVRDEIADKLDIEMGAAGEHVLKNIARPVRVWRVRFEKEVRDAAAPSVPKSDRTAKKRLGWPAKAAIAFALLGLVAAGFATYPRANGGSPPATAYHVAPFVAASDTGPAKPLAEALTVRLVTGLGTIPYIRVVEATASASNPTAGASYVISGRVETGNTTARVEARITESATGQVLATTSFEAPLRDVADMQDELLGRIGDDLSVEVNRLLYPVPIDAPDKQRARALAQEARLRVDLRTEPQRAIALFDEATVLNPQDIDIAGWRANNFVAIGSLEDPGSPERKGHLDAARKILEENKSKVQLHRLLSYAQCQMLNYSGELQAARVACDETRRLLPWSARVEKEAGSVWMKLGQLDRALAAFTRADRLEKRYSIRWSWLAPAGLVCLLLDRNEEAVAWLARATA